MTTLFGSDFFPSCGSDDHRSHTNERPADAWELTVEVLGGHVGVALELLVEEDDGGGEDGEQRAEAEDDDVADGLGEGGVTLEVTLHAGVLGEGRDELIGEPFGDDGRHGGWGILRENCLGWHFASSAILEE